MDSQRDHTTQNGSRLQRGDSWRAERFKGRVHQAGVAFAGEILGRAEAGRREAEDGRQEGGRVNSRRRCGTGRPGGDAFCRRGVQMGMVQPGSKILAHAALFFALFRGHAGNGQARHNWHGDLTAEFRRSVGAYTPLDCARDLLKPNRANPSTKNLAGGGNVRQTETGAARIHRRAVNSGATRAAFGCAGLRLARGARCLAAGASEGRSGGFTLGVLPGAASRQGSMASSRCNSCSRAISACSSPVPRRLAISSPSRRNSSWISRRR